MVGNTEMLVHLLLTFCYFYSLLVTGLIDQVYPLSTACPDQLHYSTDDLLRLLSRYRSMVGDNTCPT